MLLVFLVVCGVFSAMKSRRGSFTFLDGAGVLVVVFVSPLCAVNSAVSTLPEPDVNGGRFHSAGKLSHQSDPAISYFGSLPWDVLSPVGINDRYLCTRLTARF